MPRTPSGNTITHSPRSSMCAAVLGRSRRRRRRAPRARSRTAGSGSSTRHAAHDARRLGLEQHRDRRASRASNGSWPAWFAISSTRPCGHVLDAVGLDAEVVACRAARAGSSWRRAARGSSRSGSKPNSLSARRDACGGGRRARASSSRTESGSSAPSSRSPSARARTRSLRLPRHARSVVAALLEDLFEPEERAEAGGVDEALARERDRELEVVDRAGGIRDQPQRKSRRRSAGASAARAAATRLAVPRGSRCAAGPGPRPVDS